MAASSRNIKLFINYRREDTAPYVGRLYDRLKSHFGENQVFIDIDQIQPGEDFIEAINRKVAVCDVAIVAIGPRWLSVTDASGKRRLDNNEDFVRMEIVAALERKIRVIPLLVGGALMPSPKELPNALALLSRRNAIEVSETRFHADVDRLIKAIERAILSSDAEGEQVIASFKQRFQISGRKRRYILAILSLFIVAGLLGIKIWKNRPDAKSALAVAIFFSDARKSTPPCPTAIVDVIRDLSTQLKEDFSASNRNRPDGSFNSWTEAQMVVSLEPEGAVDPGEMSEWFQGQVGKASGSQIYPGGAETFGVTGWVLLAFARIHVRPMEQQIEFVLRNQERPGWWPMYPAFGDPRGASTYATAICTWALSELSRRDLTANSQKETVNLAVRKSREWLLNNAVLGQPARWKDYPHGEYGQESIGLSGIVLHVLHCTPGPAPLESDRYWMANLPMELPDPKENSSSGQAILTKEYGVLSDPTHQFALPWLVAATADAYAEGTLTQRAQAVRLFKQIPEKRETIARDLKNMPWIAAETLISLRHLQARAAGQRQR